MTKAEKARRWADMIIHHIEQQNEESFINKASMTIIKACIVIGATLVLIKFLFF